MKFEISEKELETLEALKEAVKLLHEDVGPIIYSFTSGSGIGVGVKVTFEKHNITKDITDYGSW